LLEGRVCIDLDLVFGQDVIKFEVDLTAMSALDHKLFVPFRPFGHVSYADATNIVVTAV